MNFLLNREATETVCGAGHWKTERCGDLAMWHLPHEPQFYVQPRIIGFGNFQETLLEQVMEVDGLGFAACFEYVDGLEGNSQFAYPLIEVHATDEQQIAAASNKNKRRRILRDIIEQTDTEGLVVFDNQLYDWNWLVDESDDLWSGAKGITQDANFDVVVKRLLLALRGESAIRNDFSVSNNISVVTAKDRHNTILSCFIVMENGETLQSLCQIKFLDVKTKLTTQALIRWARDNGFKYLDVDNLSNAEAVNYKTVFFNGERLDSVYLTREMRRLVIDNREAFPWIKELQCSP